MRYAVLVSGGKQYLALEGGQLEVDRLSTDEGRPVEFDDILLVAEDNRVQVGRPTVSGAVVRGRVVSHLRGPKIRVFKYSPKKRTRKRRGHRQDLTRVAIEVIDYPGADGERTPRPGGTPEGPVAANPARPGTGKPGRRSPTATRAKPASKPSRPTGRPKKGARKTTRK
jgi:large subunit ribosomal protein L21